MTGWLGAGRGYRVYRSLLQPPPSPTSACHSRGRKPRSVCGARHASGIACSGPWLQQQAHRFDAPLQQPLPHCWQRGTIRRSEKLREGAVNQYPSTEHFVLVSGAAPEAADIGPGLGQPGGGGRVGRPGWRSGHRCQSSRLCTHLAHLTADSIFGRFPVQKAPALAVLDRGCNARRSLRAPQCTYRFRKKRRINLCIWKPRSHL